MTKPIEVCANRKCDKPGDYTFLCYIGEYILEAKCCAEHANDLNRRKFAEIK